MFVLAAPAEHLFAGAVGRSICVFVILRPGDIRTVYERTEVFVLDGVMHFVLDHTRIVAGRWILDGGCGYRAYSGSAGCDPVIEPFTSTVRRPIAFHLLLASSSYLDVRWMREAIFTEGGSSKVWMPQKYTALPYNSPKAAYKML